MLLETDLFSHRLYTFKDREKCQASVRYETTNPRHPSYRQVFFTAADWYDLERYGLLHAREVALRTPRGTGHLDFDSVLNTLRYMFDGLKKGVLVVIRRNTLRVFLPFCSIEHRWDDISDFLLPVPEFMDDPEPDPAKWGINNCLVRAGRDKSEGDQSYSELRHFLQILLKNRQVPDCILFFNLRDFPILREGDLHPFTSVVPPGFKLKKVFRGPKYPICSFCTHSDFSDVPVPTSDDMRRISPEFFYPDKCYNGAETGILRDWDKKISKAYFRGSATGCGVSAADNMRIKAHLLSRKHPDLLDCALVNLNPRPRKPRWDQPLSAPDFSDVRPASFATNREKSGHKYILNLDGHSRAYRLSGELGYGSVVLLQESPYRLWFERLLQPYVHFVPIQADLSDLLDRVQWCRAHDEECRRIAQNALELYQQHLGRDGVLDHMQKVIHDIASSYTSEGPLLRFPKAEVSRVAVVTVYRDTPTGDRLRQRKFFLRHVCRLPVDVYVVEQSKEHLFNIGALKNVGFLSLKKSYSSVIFTDIDMLPSQDILSHWFRPVDGGVSCLAASGTRYTTAGHKEFLFLGGMMGADPETFRKANGYPANYYGWGGEDTAMIVRLCIVGATFYVPKSGFVVDIEQDPKGRTKTIFDKLEDLKTSDTKSNHFWEAVSAEPASWKKSGLTNMQYEVLKESQMKPNLWLIKVRLPGPDSSIPRVEGDVRRAYKATRTKYTTFEANKVVWV